MSEDAETVARMTTRAQEAADDLVGTAKSLHDVASAEEMNSATFNAELDLRVFCCDGCAWWCSVEEEYNDGNCDDCSGKDDED